MVHGVPVYRLRGRLLPLVYLSRELRLDADAECRPRIGRMRVNIVVLQADDRQFGLVVDEINDTEEIVVKPLRKQLKTVKTFAGSSIMGDGKVALILDVLGLAQRASVVSETRRPRLGGKAAERRTTAGREADLSALRRARTTPAWPYRSSTLARLEEFPVAQVEKSGNAMGGAIPRPDSAVGPSGRGAGRAAPQTAAVCKVRPPIAMPDRFRCWC